MAPSVGRVVHFIAPDGAHHAAMVTEVLPESPVCGIVSLCVMSPDGISIKLDVPYEDNGRPGTWHFPERVE